MFKRLQQWWEELKRGRPGSRFQEQHDRNRSERKSRVGRMLRVAAGVLLIPVGVFFLAVPGPGLIIVGVGAVLIAREFGAVARVLDAIEVRGRKSWDWARRRWRRLVKRRRSVTR